MILWVVDGRAETLSPATDHESIEAIEGPEPSNAVGHRTPDASAQGSYTTGRAHPMVTRVSEPARAMTAAGATVVQRCESCEVTWRGPASVPCWCCGSPGARQGEIRIVPD